MNEHLFEIRNETPDDYAAIRATTTAAFAGSEYGDNGEADLVDRLRASSVNLLSLVASAEGEIVGHALFTSVTIRTSQHEIHGMGLAPMSVVPGRQRCGIGTALVEYGFERLYADDCPFIVVLGHPEYYPRFGFRPAREFNVSHGFPGIPQEVFFIHIPSDNILKHGLGGRARYQTEFGKQDEA